MKKLLFKTILSIVISVLGFLTATAQNTTASQTSVGVYPLNPSPTDSVRVGYAYVSNDGCPDYYLVIDSVVDNRIYVNKKEITGTRICTQVISKFAAIINLGIILKPTLIYFEGKLINTVIPLCKTDKQGIVVEGKDIFKERLFIQEISPISSYIPLYAIPNVLPSNLPKLNIGDKVNFGGYLQKNDSAAAAIYPQKIVGVATCWNVIPDSSTCIMNRKGEIAGTTENSSIVKDLSTGEKFEIKGVKLAIGSIITFKGTIIQCVTIPCYNIVDCYKIVSVPPAPCVTDKMGIVVQGVGECTGQLFIELISPAAIAVKQLYKFNNNTLSPDGTVQPVLKPGVKVQFGGYLVSKDNSTVQPCNIIGVATCWNIISDSTACVMNRKGFVTELTENSSIVKDISTAEKFEIKGVKLVTGSAILFKGTIIQCITAPCLNIVDCYQIISVPPTPCVMDKTGVVVPGVDGCTGRLFVQETTESSGVPNLYVLRNYINSNSAGTTISKLQAGDKVKFSAVLTANDSTKSVLCYTVGEVKCWELIPSTNKYNLGGKVMAGDELMKSGLAVLFKKGDGKAVASYTITDGTFSFSNISAAAYTLYVIPDISIYKNYLPTFYVNKFLFEYADYIKLNSDVNDMTVYLRNLNMPTGTGKISGNIYYEKEQLKDSILAAKGSLSSITNTNNTAENVTVVLFDNTGQPAYWTITDAVGNYSFGNLSLNTYNIISETASARGEATVSLTPVNTTASADLILKSPQELTINKQVNDQLINLYPNPVKDRLVISVKENYRLNIFSTIGQLIFNRTLNSGINEVDVSTLQKGIYIVKIGNTSIRLLKE